MVQYGASIHAPSGHNVIVCKYWAITSSTSSPPLISHTAALTVAQIQTAGYSRSILLRRKRNGVDPFAEFAMTKPEMTKKISTPTQPQKNTRPSGKLIAPSTSGAPLLPGLRLE